MTNMQAVLLAAATLQAGKPGADPKEYVEAALKLYHALFDNYRMPHENDHILTNEQAAAADKAKQDAMFDVLMMDLGRKEASR